ncbi:unnamed protein product, partial [Ectocarpus fasciculatus]
MEGSPEDLYQTALLIDQLKHDDAQMRVNASRSLVQIARALGPERTRNELIPFLTESLDDEDEVLQVLSEQLRELIPFMGSADHAHLLLRPLETLIMVEESTVREAALSSMEAVLNSMTSDQLAEQYVPLLNRLATNDWFTSRMSSAALFHIAYKKLADPLKQKSRALFLKLCNDETPMVRRTAALNYGKMAKLVKPHELQAEFMAPLASLADDEQDSVRIQVIPMCISLAEILPLEAKMSQVLPVLLNLANDRSWRVRWALASRVHEVCGALGQQISNNSLSAAYEALLNDTEAEVRSAAASTMVLVCGTLRKDVIVSQILPAAARLAGDVSEHVRASLALVVNGMAGIIGKEGSVEHVLPVLLLLLRDEVSDVRLNIISSLDTVNAVIGVELLSQSLLPAIVDLAEDPKWRVRMAIIELIPMLGQQLGKAFFSEKLNNLCLTCLGDDVYSVRRLAAGNLEKLCTLFGEDWCCSNIVPRLQKMHSHTNYLQRMTSLYGAEVLSQSLSPDILETELVPMAMDMTGDAVPNVRFTVAKTLEALCTGGVRSSALLDDIDAALHSLSTDSDRDVRFYAMKVRQHTAACI